MIKSVITDPSVSAYTHIDTAKGEKNGLVVASRELKQYQFAQRFFVNSIYGVEMNQNGTGFHDITELIYDEDDGTPAEWDWTSIIGLWDFASTTYVYSGTVSIDGTQTGNGSVSQGDNGSLFDLSNYNVLTGYIYLTGWPTIGTKQVLIYGWNTGTGTIVGNSVNIGNYINTLTLNTWQRFIIPLDDLDLSGKNIDAIRVQNVSTGGGSAPDFYLDTLCFGGISGTDTTGILEYTIESDQHSWLHVYGLNITMVDEYDSTLANATMPNLPYNTLLGVPELENGILLQVKSGGEFLFTNVFRTLFDFISLTSIRIDCSGSDGTYTWLKLYMEFVQPIILKSEEVDKLSITIRDDLSQLVRMRCSTSCKLENRHQ